MPDYISSSACRGRRPRISNADRPRSRPESVARMLRERSVARFLVAPEGFGKTQLALEYASVVFSFESTFWLDAKSPCFLRDLDRGSLVEDIVAKDPSVLLVVFDGVPRLDDVRADAFSCVVDMLLERGTEVVTTMSPSCDAYASRQPDRVVLTSRDLLLSDGEVGVCRRGTGDADGQAERVPVVAWGGEAGCERLVRGIVAEGLPSDTLLLAFRMLVFVSGLVEDDVFPLPSPVVRRELAEFAAAYPYFGIDDGVEHFAAPDLPIECVARAFATRLGDLAEASGAADSDELVAGLADALLFRGRPERACRLVACAATRLMRETWLAEHDEILFDSCSLAPASALFAAARPSRESGGGWLHAREAARRLVLGDLPGAYEMATILGKSASVHDEARSFSLIVAACAACDEELPVALGALERSVLPDDVPDGEPHPGVRYQRPSRSWRAAAAIVFETQRDLAAAARAWGSACRAGIDEVALVAAASAVAAAARKALPTELLGLEEPFSAMASLLAGYAERDVAARGEAGLWAADALRTLGTIRSLVPDACAVSVEPAVSLAARDAFARLFEQRTFGVSVRSGEQGEAELRRSEQPSRPAPAVPPILRVELFGGMSVSIGGKPVDERAFGRRKLKTLLALLAIDAGREIPRDRLAEALWPNRPIDAARKNIYSLWSRLKRALTLPDGSCPYLVRMPNGYKLDDAWFESDVRRVDEICRTLLFGRADSDEWVDALGELDSIASGGLMPCETDNDEIEFKRREYHVRIVDSLTGASRRLLEEGDAQAALWFARAAHELERGREDVYCALMRAQIASGQRAAALATYFECRRFLADGLGIDPSSEIVELYRSVIEEEAPLDW